MTRASQTTETRIALLAISETEREEAIAYVRAGENLAEAALAIMHFFMPRATQKLRHTH